MSSARGREGEDCAAQYLTERGFRIFHRNYRTREGEIDIVARDGGEVVFVEVKQRRSAAFGDGIEAVDVSKQRKLSAAIEAYRQEFLREEDPVRVDVIAFNPDGTVEHVRGVELEE